MNLENLVLYVAFTMGKASSLDLSTDFCKSAFHGGLVSHMQNVLTSAGTGGRLEATASRLEATASRLEAIASRLEAIASRLEAIA